MSIATRNIITATAAIVKMDADARETLLLTILESNPAPVLAAMKINGVTFGDATTGTFKVVLAAPTTSKIGIIKLFREVAGFGLADSKAWSEGKTMGACDAGTFKRFMSKHDADALAHDLNYRATTEHVNNGYTASPTGIKVKVIKDSAHHDYRSLVNWHVEPCEF